MTSDDPPGRTCWPSKKAEDGIEIYTQPPKPHPPMPEHSPTAATFVGDLVHILAQRSDQLWYLWYVTYSKYFCRLCAPVAHAHHPPHWQPVLRTQRPLLDWPLVSTICCIYLPRPSLFAFDITPLRFSHNGRLDKMLGLGPQVDTRHLKY